VKVRVASDQTAKLVAALKRAGRREIGGQLFGEQLAPSQFAVTELAIQAKPGTVTRFVVDLVQAARVAVRFFDRTKHRYTQYNYIGEWHSHPSFAVQPSNPDIATMRSLVKDPGFKGLFAVLVIVRLDGDTLSAGAWLFDPQGEEPSIDLEIDLEQ
jgi:[CysO sulfur-carrier protein]-S-L-cysteine hydrolase